MFKNICCQASKENQLVTRQESCLVRRIQNRCRQDPIFGWAVVNFGFFVSIFTNISNQLCVAWMTTTCMKWVVFLYEQFQWKCECTVDRVTMPSTRLIGRAPKLPVKPVFWKTVSRKSRLETTEQHSNWSRMQVFLTAPQNNKILFGSRHFQSKEAKQNTLENRTGIREQEFESKVKPKHKNVCASTKKSSQWLCSGKTRSRNNFTRSNILPPDQHN